MALIPTLSIARPPILGKAINVVVNVSNTGSTAITITDVRPYSFGPVGSVSFGEVRFGNLPTQILNAASLNFTFSAVFNGPQRQGQSNAGAGELKFNIYALCTFSDGTSAVSSSISVYPNLGDNTPIGSTVVAGQYRFDTYTNSGLFAVGMGV